MVSSEQRYSVPVLDLQDQNIAETLKGVVPSVDVVAEEQKVRFRRRAADLEDLQQIVELAVDVPNDSHWARYARHVGLPGEHLLGYFQ